MVKPILYRKINHQVIAFIAIIFLLLLVSCGKKRTVHGRIYNPVNNKGIAGINVYLMKEKICLGYGCDDKVIESTTTDADGYYAISYRERSGGQFLNFEYQIDDYERLNSNIPGISGNQEYDLLLVTKGYLQKTITNINCFDANDKLTITNVYHKSIPELNSTTTAIYPGCMNQTYSNSYVPMGWYVWKGTVTKNGITTPFADSIYVPEGGSVQWSIEY